MDAAELDVRARLRAHVRKTIAALRHLGVPEERIRGRNILELDDLLRRAHQDLMREPRTDS